MITSPARSPKRCRSALHRLALAVGCLSRFLILRQLCRFYIEVMRGIPIIVLLLYVAFVLAPLVVAGWNAVAEPLGLGEIRTRDFPLLWRAVLAMLGTRAALLPLAFVQGALLARALAPAGLGRYSATLLGTARYNLLDKAA